MDTVTILRDLWRLRRFVVVAALIAVLAGLAVGYKITPPGTLESRRYEVGVATARILVDTPNSQVVEVSPKGSDTLGVRANLLASLMVGGAIKSTIAQEARIPPAQLVSVTDAATQPTPDTVPSHRGAYILRTQVLTNTSGDQLPIIEIDVQAPFAGAAARLAAAAVDGLRSYLNTRAAAQRISNADRLQVISLGAPQAGAEHRGPSPLMSMIAGIFFFIIGCAAILAIRSLSLALRAVAEHEQLGSDGSAAADAVEPQPQPQPQAQPDRPARRRPTLVPSPGRPSRATKSYSDLAWDEPAPLRAAAED